MASLFQASLAQSPSRPAFLPHLEIRHRGRLSHPAVGAQARDLDVHRVGLEALRIACCAQVAGAVPQGELDGFSAALADRKTAGMLMRPVIAGEEGVQTLDPVDEAEVLEAL